MRSFTNLISEETFLEVSLLLNGHGKDNGKLTVTFCVYFINYKVDLLPAPGQPFVTPRRKQIDFCLSKMKMLKKTIL